MAAAITEALLAFLEEQNLDPKKCVGLATDGCNAIVGAYNSVATKFKEVNPDFVHIRCVCHSLQLCASYAIKKLPHNLEFLVAETYTYFSHSTLRQWKCQQMYKFMNVGEGPLKILQLSGTRWLAIAPCVTRVLWTSSQS